MDNSNIIRILRYDGKVDFIHKIFGLNESSNLKLKIPSDILKIHKAFKKSGKKLYVVGGALEMQS